MSFKLKYDTEPKPRVWRDVFSVTSMPFLLQESSGFPTWEMENKYIGISSSSLPSKNSSHGRQIEGNPPIDSWINRKPKEWFSTPPTQPCTGAQPQPPRTQPRATKCQCSRKANYTSGAPLPCNKISGVLYHVHSVQGIVCTQLNRVNADKFLSCGAVY